MTTHFIQLHLCLQYTCWSFKPAFTARPAIHHLLLQTSASSSVSVAEAAAQQSVGTVEEIRDRHSRRQMAMLCTISLGAVCHYRILKPLIQHSLELNAGLLQGAELALWLQLTSFLSFPSVSFKFTLLSISPLTAEIIVILWFL